MSDVRVSKPTLVFGVLFLIVLGAAAVVIAVLLTKVQAQGQAPAAGFESAPEVFSTPSVEYLVSRASGGASFPALRAVGLDCGSYTVVEAVSMVADVDMSQDLRAVTIDGFTQEQLAVAVDAGFASPDQFLDVHACALEMLDAPPGILERMERTRAVDGTQQDSWPGYRITWTYHPDSGLDAVVSYAD